MKKLPIVASIAMLGALSVVGFCKPIYEVRAEEPNSEPQTSEVVSSSQESVVSSQEEKKWEDVQNVKVEGKTIKEWIEGIKNEETRRSTLFALLIACGGVVLIGLKWIAEHKVISKTKLISELNLQSIKDIKDLEAKYNEALEQAKAKAEAINDDLNEKIEKFASLVASDSGEREAIRQALLEIAKSNESMVAHGTFKKVRGIFEEADNGKD